MGVLCLSASIAPASPLEDRFKALEKKVTYLENRVTHLERAKAPLSLSSAGAIESQDYNQALALLKDAQYKEAREAFSKFCATYPHSASLPAASYWLAVACFAQAEYERAAQLFQTFLEKWPKSEKVMDVRLKLILCYQRLEDLVKARQALADFREALDQQSFSDPMARDVLRQRADALERTFEQETLKDDVLSLPGPVEVTAAS